jgi:hypothetical protein
MSVLRFEDLTGVSINFGVYLVGINNIIIVIIIKNCPARCAYAANAVGKDLDVFAIGAVSLNHLYTHQPKIVNIICSKS